MIDKQLPFWFPKYVYMTPNEYGDDIWVLRNLIDDHTAYYWRVCGEWGRTVKYNGLMYAVEGPSNSGFVARETLIPASPEAFLKDNQQLATDWSKKACEEAWEEIKESNPLAKEQKWDLSPGGYWYHTEVYIENKFIGWEI